MPGIFLPRSPGVEGLAALGALAGLLLVLARGWREAARARLLAACLPAARENAARHLLPLAEAALRARRLLERARDPLEPEAAALEPGFTELLRLVRGMRGLPGSGGALWLGGARAEVAVSRLWAVLDAQLRERLGGDLDRAAAGEVEALAKLRPPFRRWLRGEPGPDAELWLLQAFGTVLETEIRRIDRLIQGKGKLPRQERRVLEQLLGEVPPDLPDRDALTEALEDWRFA